MFRITTIKNKKWTNPEKYTLNKGNKVPFEIKPVVNYYMNFKSLENWNISKGNKFRTMFSGCLSLSELKPIQNLNISNGNEFVSMFSGYSSLPDLKPIQKLKCF